MLLFVLKTLAVSLTPSVGCADSSLSEGARAAFVFKGEESIEVLLLIVLKILAVSLTPSVGYADSSLGEGAYIASIFEGGVSAIGADGGSY